MKTQDIMNLISSGAVDFLDSLPVSPEKINTVVETIDAIRSEFKLVEAGYKKLFTQFAKGAVSIDAKAPGYADFVAAQKIFFEEERKHVFDAVFTEEEIKTASRITPAQFRAIKAAGLIKKQE